MDLERLKAQKKALSGALAGKTILISGSTGLVGSRIVEFLLGLNDTCGAKIRVLGLYRSEGKKNAVFSHLLTRTEVQFVRHEIGEPFLLDMPIDYVIHCAGISGGLKMHLTDPVKVFDIGLGGTREMLDFAVEHGCTGFLYVSTYEIYGTVSKQGLIREDQACELDTFTLRNIYAEIKRLCESLCCAYSAKYNLDTYAARLTSTFGTGVSYEDSRFFAEFARCIMEGRDIILKSKGETVRSYLDADDAASAFLYILAYGESKNAYNLTNMDQAISIKEMALKMLGVSHAKTGLKFDIAEDFTKMGFRKEGTTLMDASKIEALGWKPVYTLEDTLEKLMASMETGKPKLQ